MDTFREFISSVNEAIRQRLGNPLLGAFLIAWTGWNFRLIMTMLGDDQSREKIRYIDTVLYPGWIDWLTNGAILPLISALVFVFTYPFVNRWLLAFYREQQKLTIERILEIEERTPLTQEDADALRKRIKIRELELTQKILDQSKEIEDLNAALRKSHEETKSLQSEILKKLAEKSADVGTAANDGNGTSSAADLWQISAAEPQAELELKPAKTNEEFFEVRAESRATHWAKALTNPTKEVLQSLVDAASKVSKFTIEKGSIVGESPFNVDKLEQSGISQIVFQILAVASLKRAVPKTFIAQALDLPSLQVDANVDRIVGLGLAERQKINIERGVAPTEAVSLTPLGRQVLDLCLQQLS